jgi:hypothetical protein
LIILYSVHPVVYHKYMCSSLAVTATNDFMINQYYSDCILLLCCMFQSSQDHHQGSLNS